MSFGLPREQGLKSRIAYAKGSVGGRSGKPMLEEMGVSRVTFKKTGHMEASICACGASSECSCNDLVVEFVIHVAWCQENLHAGWLLPVHLLLL